MSTHGIGTRSRFLENVAFFALAVALAGCSDHASRFADPLFTASVPQQPQQFQGNELQNQFGAAVPSAQVPGRIRRNVPQRIDLPSGQGAREDLFNARNVTQLSKRNGFGAIPPTTNFGNSPVLQQQTFQTPQSGFGAPVATRPAFGTSQNGVISSQSLPAAQALPGQTTLKSTPLNTPTGGRLTLEQARAVNDSEEGISAPVFQNPASTPFRTAQTAQTAQTLALPARTFPTGTEWTRQFSPIPTESPAPKLPVALSGSPKAYTPPSGVYTANVDRVSTSSVRQFRAPRVIRSSVATSHTRKAARKTPGIDKTTVASVNAVSSSKARPGGWSGTGGTYISLKSGETLYSLSRRYGVPVDAITRANGISDPGSVRAGQKILIPTYVYSPDAPVSAPDVKRDVTAITASTRPSAPTIVRSSVRSVKAPLQPLPPVVDSRSGRVAAHTVQKGDTLSRLAVRYNVKTGDIQQANGLDSADVIRIGQVLSIPALRVPARTAAISPARPRRAVAGLPRLDNTTTSSIKPVAFNATAIPRVKPTYRSAPANRRVAEAATLRVVIAGKPSANPLRRVAVARSSAKPSKRVALPALKPRSSGSTAVAAYTPPKIDRVVTASVKPAPVTHDTKLRKGAFAWPVRGEMIAGFGRTRNGKQNDGINLKVPTGTPVRAAAAGEVIYASNGLADYGNLVLIRHADGFVSAYAHNSSLAVRRGQRVRQGQVVAKSGQSGSVTSPQVHFEIRKGKKPVDPLVYL